MDPPAGSPSCARPGCTRSRSVPFGERHSAWWWYAGWREAYNPGKGGKELADDVTPLALDWIRKTPKAITGSCTSTTGTRTRPTARRRNTATPLPTTRCRTGWRAPGAPKGGVLQRCWAGFGPHSAREPQYDLDGSAMWRAIPARAAADRLDGGGQRQWIDGYDTGVLVCRPARRAAAGRAAPAGYIWTTW